MSVNGQAQVLDQRRRLGADLLYLLIGMGAAIAFSWAMLRGEWQRIAIAVALAAIVGLVLARTRLARIRLVAAMFTLAAALPALGVMGAPLSMPGARGLFAFRLALGLLALLAVVRLSLGSAKVTIGPSGVVKALGLWYLWMVVTLLWAPDPVAGLRYLFVVATMLVITAAIAATAARPRYLAAVLWLLGITLALTLLVSAMELATGYHLPGSAALLVNKLGRQATAWFVNTNDLATFLAMCWPFLLLGTILPRTLWMRLVAVAMLLATGGVVVFTGSRSSLVTIGVETIIAGIIAVRRRWITGRQAAIPGVFLLVLVLGIAVLSLARIDVPVLNQFSLAGLVEDVQTGQGSGDVRLSLAKAGVTAAMRSFGMGVGPGNAEAMVKQSEDVTVGFGNLHSWWFETFVNSGLPGLLMFSIFYFGLIVLVARASTRLHGHNTRWFAASTLIALLGYILGAFGPSTAVSFPPMWVLLGLGLAIVVLSRRSMTAETGALAARASAAERTATAQVQASAAHQTAAAQGQRAAEPVAGRAPATTAALRPAPAAQAVPESGPASALSSPAATQPLPDGSLSMQTPPDSESPA